MADQQLTQKDLDLVPDPEDGSSKDIDDSADNSGDKAPDASAKGGDKPADAPKGDGLFDGLDDDDGGKPAKAAEKKPELGAEKDADGAKAADGEKPADAKDEKKPEETEEQKRERLAADAAWRDKVADKILTPLKDKLSAKKFEQRREQIINQLKRAKSIEDAVVSGLLAQEKLRSGDHKRPPEDASSEEAAKWRKENDIPEAPEKYEIPVIPGHKWTDADQPLIDSFRGAAHGANLNQNQVNALVSWQIQQQQNAAEEMDAKLKSADAEDRDACYDAIRTEFGITEFKPSMAIMKRLIEDDDVFGGKENADRIMAARYYDDETNTWRRITSIPAVARGLIGLALDRYGDVAMPAGDGRTQAGQSRLEEINKIMATDWDRYHREGLADEAMQIQKKMEDKANRRAARAAR
jgi:hypothetical protein